MYIFFVIRPIFEKKKLVMFNLSFREVEVIPNQNMFLFRVTTQAKLK
jgi:hypothetical protein